MVDHDSEVEYSCNLWYLVVLLVACGAAAAALVAVVRPLRRRPSPLARQIRRLRAL